LRLIFAAAAYCYGGRRQQKNFLCALKFKERKKMKQKTFLEFFSNENYITRYSNTYFWIALLNMSFLFVTFGYESLHACEKGWAL
jgi:hypothetical protein